MLLYQITMIDRYYCIRSFYALPNIFWSTLLRETNLAALLFMCVPLSVSLLLGGMGCLWSLVCDSDIS